MEESDLEQVLSWRNHPEIRRYMYSTHEIPMDEHCAWYASSSTDPRVELLIYEQGCKAQGFVNITRTGCANVADWGFYMAPDAPKGCGRDLGKQALDYAFTKLRLHKVCGEVLGVNTRSIAFHKSLGFTEEGRLREQHCDASKFHDVVCFGLLSSEWQARFED
ncbi:UDP-4-amino-4,6-dideoxy-N-acetyl-beta-L-altrosamine N-acetyltransferase [Marinobacterium sp. LSUCC0821]|nr:UDP-4-amino-4,6-dideoxy-N-acetyl-beta-L-altrosamine N-acetyltransferase [Marinobacterium sp. LSUCC0821]